MYEQQPKSHWHLLRDLLRFQLKLILDGLRDLVLSPVSIAAAIYGVITCPQESDRYFKRLMAFGRQSDHWIHLFGDPEHEEVHKDSAPQDSEQTSNESQLVPRQAIANTQQRSDDYIQKLESLVISQYEKGGLVKGIKDSTDELVKRIQDKRSSRDK